MMEWHRFADEMPESRRDIFVGRPGQDYVNRAQLSIVMRCLWIDELESDVYLSEIDAPTHWMYVPDRPEPPHE